MQLMMKGKEKVSTMHAQSIYLISNLLHQHLKEDINASGSPFIVYVIIQYDTL